MMLLQISEELLTQWRSLFGLKLDGRVEGAVLIVYGLIPPGFKEVLLDIHSLDTPETSERLSPPTKGGLTTFG